MSSPFLFSDCLSTFFFAEKMSPKKVQSGAGERIIFQLSHMSDPVNHIVQKLSQMLQCQRFHKFGSNLLVSATGSTCSAVA